MAEKRICSVLIPYRREGEVYSIFLQKRSADAKRAPGCFGFWGGGAEAGETPEEALRREMREELDYAPEGYRFFRRFEFERSVLDVFLWEAAPDFEAKITICEGEYGQWFTVAEALALEKLIDHNRLIVNEIDQLIGADGTFCL